MIASSAKTFEQQPPKIRLSMTDTARKEGIVSLRKDIMRFRSREDWSERSFSDALLGGLVAFVFVEEEVLVGRIGSGAPFDCASVLSLGSIVSTVVVLCRLVALEEVMCAPLLSWSAPVVVYWVLLLGDCVVLAVSLGVLAFALRLIFTYTGKTNDEDVGGKGVLRVYKGSRYRNPISMRNLRLRLPPTPPLVPWGGQ